jgi:hypothetical protein
MEIPEGQGSSALRSRARVRDECGTALARVVAGGMRSSSLTPKGLFVTIVSSNRATLEGLESYLRGAGVATSSTPTVDRVLEVTPRSSAAVILFPDEYGREGVLKAIAALGRERPDVLTVIVTNEPRRFRRIAGHGSAHTRPLVVPKPPWAWTLLDIVRARLEAGAPPDDAS